MSKVLRICSVLYGFLVVITTNFITYDNTRKRTYTDDRVKFSFDLLV